MTLFFVRTVKKYWPAIIFCFVSFLTLFFRLNSVADYNIAFTPDQARDMLEIRQIAVGHSPKLLGPITDILGLYLGPFWYYFNLFPFVISGGDPLALVYFSIAVFHLFSFLVYWGLSKKDKTLALFSSAFLLLSPVSFLTTRYAFNANAIFYFTALYPVFFYFQSAHFSLLEGLLCGLVLQLEAAVGILFFPISLFVHLKKDRPHRHIFPLVVGFGLTLIPQIVFEITHQFSMTRSFFSEFAGGSSFLGSKMTLFQMLADRANHFLNLFTNAAYLPVAVILLVVVTGLIASSKKSTTQKYLKLNLSLLIIFLIFFLIYPFKLKDWYLYGLVPFAIYSFSSSILTIGSHCYAKIAPAVFLVLVIISSSLANLRYLSNLSLEPSDDPSNLHNMLTVVDKVYGAADNQAFNVYSYLPSVYDYSYQYIFWWYGTRKYGYQPTKISYLPNVPEYIKDNSVYWTKTKPGTPASEFLIIQHDLANPQRESEWRRQYPQNHQTEVTDFPWNITLERNRSLVN